MNTSQELLLYKNLGETPLECLECYRSEHQEFTGVPMTYAGRLDPMAEGLLLVLTGDLVKEKENYTDLDKEYEFEILWGVETDTYDLLGKVTSTSFLHPDYEKIKEAIERSSGIFEQTYPAYSSKTVNGKQLHRWAREGKIDEIELPKKTVEIKSIEFLENRNIYLEILKKEILEKIDLVKGDFRQEEIKESWMPVFTGMTNASSVIPAKAGIQEPFGLITKARASVTSGTYIRSLVSELGRRLGSGAIAYSIKRTRIGNYFL